MAKTFSSSEGTNPEAYGSSEWLLTLVPALIWGTSFLLIAVALDDFSPGVIAFGRIAAGAAVIACFRAARLPIDPSDRLRIVALAFFWMALPFTLFPVAEQWIDSSLAGMLNGATPLFTAAVASVFLRRPPGAAQALGLAVGFVGVVGVMWPALDGDASPLGAALVLVAAASYGLSLNLVVPLQQRYGARRVLFWTQMVGLAMTAPLATIGVFQSSFSWASLSAVVVLGAGATGLAFIAMVTLTGRAGATRASVAVYLVPIVAIAAGVIWRDERVAAVSLVGVVVVLAGAWLTSRSEAATVATRIVPATATD